MQFLNEKWKGNGTKIQWKRDKKLVLYTPNSTNPFSPIMFYWLHVIKTNIVHLYNMLSYFYSSCLEIQQWLGDVTSWPHIIPKLTERSFASVCRQVELVRSWSSMGCCTMGWWSLLEFRKILKIWCAWNRTWILLVSS